MATLLVLNSITLITASTVIMFATSFYTREMKENANKE